MTFFKFKLVTFALTLVSFSFSATAENIVKKEQTDSAASSSILVDASVMPVHQSTIDTIMSNKDIAAAFKTIELDRKKNIDLLIELTEIPAPPFGEKNRAERFAELLQEVGLEDVKIDDEGNVLGRRPGTKRDKTIAISAHIDTVFPLETDVTVKIEGDTYTAPGIGDNTRGLVVLLSIVRALEINNIETEADLLFIGNVGEEGLGDLRGVKHLYRDGGPKIDALIAIDGGANNRLIYGGVGSYRYRVIIEGPGGHSWGAFGEANPHHALGRGMALFAQRAPEVTSSGLKTTFNVGRIGGGTSINSIPFESWMEVDMRSGDTDKLKEIDAVFNIAIQEGLNAENSARTSGPELTVTSEKIGVRPAGRGDPKSPLVQHALAAMTSLGVSPELKISSTDANIPISLGLPAITLSRGGVSRHAHSLNESWTDKDAHKGIQVAFMVVMAQAGYSSPQTK